MLKWNSFVEKFVWYWLKLSMSFDFIHILMYTILICVTELLNHIFFSMLLFWNEKCSRCEVYMKKWSISQVVFRSSYKKLCSVLYFSNTQETLTDRRMLKLSGFYTKSITLYSWTLSILKQYLAFIYFFYKNHSCWKIQSVTQQ